MEHQLSMFFRDELISWSWRRPPGMSSAPTTPGGISSSELKQKVTANVDQVMVRVKAIAPQCFPEEVCRPLFRTREVEFCLEFLRETQVAGCEVHGH